MQDIGFVVERLVMLLQATSIYQQSPAKNCGYVMLDLAERTCCDHESSKEELGCFTHTTTDSQTSGHQILARLVCGLVAVVFVWMVS